LFRSRPGVGGDPVNNAILGFQADEQFAAMLAVVFYELLGRPEDDIHADELLVSGGRVTTFVPNNGPTDELGGVDDVQRTDTTIAAAWQMNQIHADQHFSSEFSDWQIFGRCYELASA
jgi:hypothetical protein